MEVELTTRAGHSVTVELRVNAVTGELAQSEEDLQETLAAAVGVEDAASITGILSHASGHVLTLQQFIQRPCSGTPVCMPAHLVAHDGDSNVAGFEESGGASRREALYACKAALDKLAAFDFLMLLDEVLYVSPIIAATSSFRKCPR